jgi:hypothetical protein
VNEDLETLAARVAELERRMDSVMSRIGYMPGDAPLVRDESQRAVSAEVLEVARAGGDDNLAKAVYMHIKETGAEPEMARQAVLGALGRDSA